jgi:hypothetical protein
MAQATIASVPGSGEEFLHPPVSASGLFADDVFVMIRKSFGSMEVQSLPAMSNHTLCSGGLVLGQVRIHQEPQRVL